MYSGSTPILSRGQASADTIQAWFVAHGPAGAAYVGLPCAAPPADLGSSIVAVCSQAEAACGQPVNSDLVAAQIAHETSYWQSRFARDRRNPAGLGAENDDPSGKALTFITPAAGIAAQVAHLLTYVEGANNPWKALDPRYAAAAGAGYLGVARTLSDLDGRWAVPGVGYGAAIAAAANELVAFDGRGATVGDIWPTQAELGVPYHTEKADADIGDPRPVSAVRWFVVHTTEGHRASDLNILEHADPAQASVHVWISLAGEVIGIVPIAFESYTVANQAVDKVAINAELEGFARDGATEAQYVSLAAFFRWCRGAGMTVPAEYVGRDERPGIIGHMDVADPYKAGRWGGASNHTDPGPLFRFDHLIDLINGAPVTATPSAERIINGHKLAGGFRAYYEWLEGKLGANDALMLIGYPLTDEQQADGVTVQWFERARFEWHPGARPDRWDVLLARLGAEALARKDKP